MIYDFCEHYSSELECMNEHITSNLFTIDEVNLFLMYTLEGKHQCIIEGKL